MAKRRNWSTGKRLAFGLSQGAGNFLDGLMRSRLADKQAERTAKLQEERDMRSLARQGEIMAGQQAFQARQTALGELPALVDSLGPEGAMSMLDARGVDLFPPATSVDEEGTGEYGRERAAGQAMTEGLVQSLRPPMRRKLESTVGKRIGEATSPEQLLPDDIMGQLLAADDRVVPEDSEPGMRIGGFRPEAYEYQVRAEDKAEALRNKPGEPLTIENPDGSKTTRTPTRAELAAGITTAPDATTQGRLAGQTDVAKETATLNPAFQELKTRTLAKMSNLAEALTRQAKIATAAGTARATAQAQADVKYDPANVEREVALERAKNPAIDKTTEGERRAAANWTPLVNAHSNALLKEAEGVRLTPFAIEATSTPFYQTVFGGQIDKETQAYVQSARDFVSTLGYIRSGVAVRPDEVNTFIFTMFGYEGESPAQVAQKVQSREIMLGAMQAMVGRSAPEAARVLAAAINNGQIPMTLLGSLEIRPEISQHLLPLLKNAPKVDANLRPIP